MTEDPSTLGIARRQRIGPRIVYRHTSALIATCITRDDRQAVMKSRGGDDEIWLREGVTHLAAIFQQQSPFERNVFGDRQNALLEHGPQSMREPFVQCSAAAGVTNGFDTEPYLCECDCAHVKQIERLPTHKGDDLWLRSGPAKLGQHVRVEQPTRHKLTSRTGRGARLGSMSSSCSGEVCKTSTRAFPVAVPFRRRNSSAEITTTASRPCTVTS
jgi:hypothetical protein